jgi:hypothetical protein
MRQGGSLHRESNLPNAYQNRIIGNPGGGNDRVTARLSAERYW